MCSCVILLSGLLPSAEEEESDEGTGKDDGDGGGPEQCHQDERDDRHGDGQRIFQRTLRHLPDGREDERRDGGPDAGQRMLDGLKVREVFEQCRDQRDDDQTRGHDSEGRQDGAGESRLFFAEERGGVDCNDAGRANQT